MTVRPRCAFPGESCEATSTKLLVGHRPDGSELRIPLCAHHAEKALAHKAAVDLWPSVAVVEPLDESVVKTRAAINAHTRTCQQCGDVGDEIRRRLAASGVRTDPFELGLLIVERACPVGQQLWQDNGAAMLGLRGLVE
jgi:hypothetical protein